MTQGIGGVHAGAGSELVLGKQWILGLYLNVVESGPGVSGAEAASRHYYGKAARNLNREDVAQVAAILAA